jgi:hypothetical protein
MRGCYERDRGEFDGITELTEFFMKKAGYEIGETREPTELILRQAQDDRLF